MLVKFFFFFFSLPIWLRLKSDLIPYLRFLVLTPGEVTRRVQMDLAVILGMIRSKTEVKMLLFALAPTRGK